MLCCTICLNHDWVVSVQVEYVEQDTTVETNAWGGEVVETETTEVFEEVRFSDTQPKIFKTNW